MKKMTTITLALLGSLWAGSASAQTSSKDATKDCDGDYYRSIARAYLTGKSVTTVHVATAGSKKVELDKTALSTSLPKDTTDYVTSAFVSIPFTAVTIAARLVYTATKNAPHSDLTVCHFALKDTAKSWGDFEKSDLKALTGRHLGGIKEGTSASVRMGKAQPPSGYPSSTVTVALVTHFNHGTPTVKVQLKSEK